MSPALLGAASTLNPWVGPAIVAAVVSGLVALVTVGLNARRERKERQRRLFAEAFAACQAYREYPYKVRRRRSDDEAAADRAGLTKGLSEVQAHLNDFRARLRVEAPNVGSKYRELVDQTRRIAGAEIKRSWSLPAAEGDEVSVTDIDLSELDVAEDRFLRSAADHLSFWPAPVIDFARRKWCRRPRRRTAHIAASPERASQLAPAGVADAGAPSPVTCGNRDSDPRRP